MNRLTLLLLVTCLVPLGCDDQSDTIRAIQSQRQLALQERSRQDHLGEMEALLNQFVQLNETKARQQIAYHLNQWLHGRKQSGETSPENANVPVIVSTLNVFSDTAPIAESIAQTKFASEDVPWLRDAYLFRKIVEWVDSGERGDPLYEQWLDTKLEQLDEPSVDRLRTAVRLFDWTVRNVALEDDQLSLPPNLPQPQLPLGMSLEGPGYRQTDYQTVWRGRGDQFQRAGVFTQLLLQANIPNAVLAVQDESSGERKPWAVGVLIQNEIYLFQPELGLPVPGPEQVGIATLEQARKDASIMRRLDVAGYFDYPLSRTDVQQSIALLNLRPETLSDRMRKLEAALTGDRRMTLWVDTEDWTQRLDDVAGIAGVRLWDMPLLAEVYQSQLNQFAMRDPLFSFWFASRWAILQGQDAKSNNLAMGRWKHLHGQFADLEAEGEDGARTRYIEQRAPEFEIDDLRIDVELQKTYGIRRGLGMDPQVYDQQLQQVQGFMRLGKRTATYWLSLVQYEDGRFETARNWLTKRVLDEEQLSMWKDAAIYNAARSYERTGQVDEAIEQLKTDNIAGAHGNRLRARLIDRFRDAFKVVPEDHDD